VAVTRINLALQGGGAHGAFTWGVLDRLLQDDDIEIAAVSGTSAGALNGAALKSGLLEGGRAAARENLDWLWEQVGAIGDMRVAHWLATVTPGSGAISRWLAHSVPFSASDIASRIVSPYAFGPFYRNPLERIVERFHFDQICAGEPPRFFVGATNVRTGKVRIFTGTEITTDAILASACLPTVFQAAEIADPDSGETDPYWDGGYTANPPLYPLFDQSLPDDIVIVHINPLERPGLPVSALDINNRLNEISFNSSLLRELSGLAKVEELIEAGVLERGTMKDVRIHMIADDETMRELSVATKLIASPVILYRLKAAGQAAADRFLRDMKPKLGQCGTVDLRRLCGI